MNVSPGVYTKIIDLSTYVQVVPSTIGCICALTKKGEDNTLKLVSSRSALVSEFGEPDITDYGKNYGQGLYCAYNYLGESGALYFMRCLPDDASFANLKINVSLDDSDSTASIELAYVDSNEASTIAELQTALAASAPTYPLCILYPIGRGEYYNALGVRITEHANPMYNGIYVLDIYEKQSDGTDVIIESFEVSFDPTAVDTAGDSIWITYVLETYSSVLRALMELSSGAYTEGYNLVGKIYDKDIGTVSAVETAGSASITDNKQDFSAWDSALTGNATYMVIAKDGTGNKIYGWLGDIPAGATDNETINVYNARDLTTAVQSWLGETASFNFSSTITYEVKKSSTGVDTAFTSSEPVPLKKGSDGNIKNADGTLNTTNATTLLSNAYYGTVDTDILDTEEVYFTIVFDCGYPSDVKTKVSSLATTRRDCVAILDNGDNATYSAAESSRKNVNVFNNFYTALYEPYNKVYDAFTGQDVWFSPIYHMSYLIPRNDSVAEVWYAVAGFNRAAIENIKELRYNAKLAERDNMYLMQLNPIVKFSNGYTVWGQLTSQAKPSAMQDLNVVRLVLYCKKALEEYCRYFIFEQNDAITWNAVAGDVNDFLAQVQRKRGLDSYDVEVSATDYEKKRKTFHVNVTLYPTRSVEQIDLSFFIK